MGSAGGPSPNEIRWIEFDDARGKKLASKAETQLGAATRNFLYQVNSSVFIEFLETLTDIEGFIPHYCNACAESAVPIVMSAR